MISLLTSMKPFRGDATLIQTNSLRNWRQLDRNVEIIIYGDGEGISEQARRFGTKHIPQIRCNSKGVPDFSAIVEHATDYARFDIQVYLNGDILLPPDFILRINQIRFDRFLLVGQRIDLMEGVVFDPMADHWNTALLECLQSRGGRLHNSSAQDYFIFPRGLWSGLPPLIIGRGGYDNALLAHCLRRRIPIVDGTWIIPAVHQWHDYSHVKGVAETFLGEDAQSNARLHDIKHSKPNLEDAEWQLTRGGVIKAEVWSNPLRRLEIVLRFHWRLKLLSYLLRVLLRLAWLAGFLKPRQLALATLLRNSANLK